VSARRVPDLLVERLHAGDLPPDEAARIRAALEAEGGLGRLEALARDDAAFRDAHPPGPALGELRRRAGALPPPRRRPLRFRGLGRPLPTQQSCVGPRPAMKWLAAVAVAAVAAVLALRLPALHKSTGDGLEDNRTKGAAHLELHRQRAAGAAEALRGGAEARAGDLLQVSYVAGGAAYGAVVSVDGRGAVTLHLPAGPGPAAPLARGGAVPLDHAYLLDDAPRFERFFLVTSSEPFDAGAVVEAARRLAASGRADTAPLALPAGLAADDLLIVKVAR
jgi:hypothetical protein